MLGGFLNLNIKQVVFNKTEGLQSQVDQASFLLIDEADYVLIDGLQTVSNHYCIGLTATVFNEDWDVEKAHLERQGFQLYNSGMSGFIHPETATTKATVEEFFAKSDGFARLVFATGAAAESFE